MLPRVTRHLSQTKMLQLLTFLVACFSQLDVVKLAPFLDSLDDSPERSEAERQTQAFLSSVLQSILPVVAKAGLRLVTGLLSLLISRSDVVAVTQTRVCILILHGEPYSDSKCRSPV
jgi:DNA topoisomerase 2-associated protein PAT1